LAIASGSVGPRRRTFSASRATIAQSRRVGQSPTRRDEAVAIVRRALIEALYNCL